jgi:hypothetical protein
VKSQNSNQGSEIAKPGSESLYFTVRGKKGHRKVKSELTIDLYFTLSASPPLFWVNNEPISTLGTKIGYC